jgi:NodT family efflux transporter outer membrane factor (OMF) lipoprotein
MKSTRLLLVAASILVLSACATSRPEPALKAPAFKTWTAPASASGAEVRMDWWRELGDPVLDDLVQRALAKNADVGLATANYRTALALAGEVGALRVPLGTVEAAAVETRVAARAQPPGTAPDRFATQSLAQVGAALSWELDLFGGVESAVDAARSDAEGALWARRGVEAAVVGAVVRAWIDYRAANALEATLTRRVATLEGIVTRLERGLALGGVTRADLAMARAQLEMDRAQLPVLEAQKRNAARRLAVLTGDAPRPTVDGEDRSGDLHPPSIVRFDEPASVLRRRPDVAIAEARVAGAAARAGVARADLYPRVTLLASGQLTGEPGLISNAGAVGFTFGPRLQWGILDFQRTSARVKAADASAEAAAFEWEKTVLSALEEADASLDGWSQARRATVSVRMAHDATVLAYEDVNKRTGTGAESPLVLARALADRLLAEATLRAAEQRELQAWVAANLALGAGWRDASLPVRTVEGSAS